MQVAGGKLQVAMCAGPDKNKLDKNGIMNERFIHPSAEIGEGCTLGYGVVVEDSVRLGPGCSVGTTR